MVPEWISFVPKEWCMKATSHVPDGTRDHWCTLNRGHRGDHMAYSIIHEGGRVECGDVIIYQWPQPDSEEFASVCAEAIRR